MLLIREQLAYPCAFFETSFAEFTMYERSGLLKFIQRSRNTNSNHIAFHQPVKITCRREVTARYKVLEILRNNVTYVVFASVYHIHFFALYVKAQNDISGFSLSTERGSPTYPRPMTPIFAVCDLILSINCIMSSPAEYFRNYFTIFSAACPSPKILSG